MNPETLKTIENLQAALAGESMAHIKYRYFARICRQMGDEETARVFEETASQEVQHAFGHMDLLFPAETLTPEKCLQLAIEGETYEYTEMYPAFRHTALEEKQQAAAEEFEEQIAESREHADNFRSMLDKAARRFDALTRVEQRHAQHYQQQLNNLQN